MNGMATVYPRHVTNLCWCGHDFRRHNLDTTNFASTANVCNDCVSADTGGNASQHCFTSKKESWPKFMFPQVLPYGMYGSGAFRNVIQYTVQTPLIVNTAAVVGATVVVVNGFQNLPGAPGSLNQLMSFLAKFDGGSIQFRGTANPQRTDTYRITYLQKNVIGARSVYVWPPIRIQIATNNTAIILPADGNLQGAGLPMTNQRGG